MERQQARGPEVEVAVLEIAAPQEVERLEREGDVDQRDAGLGGREGVSVVGAYHHQVAGRELDLLPVDVVDARTFFYPEHLDIVVRVERQVLARGDVHPGDVEGLVRIEEVGEFEARIPHPSCRFSQR